MVTVISAHLKSGKVTISPLNWKSYLWGMVSIIDSVFMIQFLFCVSGYKFSIAFDFTLIINMFDLNTVVCVCMWRVHTSVP